MKPVKVQIDKDIYVLADALGLNESLSVQVFPVLVSSDFSVTRKHFVVCAYSTSLNQAELESVASRLQLDSAGAVCDFIIHDTEGSCNVVANINDEASAYEVAAAVGIVKASCGWDESNPIMVCVNDMEMTVFAQFNGIGWVANFTNTG
jgi:hypothetical protein